MAGIDPYSAAFLTMGKAAGGPVTSSAAASSQMTNAPDSSGWVVNFGAGDVAATRATDAAQSVASWAPWAAAALLAVVVLKKLKG